MRLQATKRFAGFVLASIRLLGFTVIATSGAFAQTVLVSVDDSNVAVGASALADNTNGDNNTAIGVSTLVRNTIGNGNTASGFEALNRNTSGSNNTASGVFALKGNTIGRNNTASGINALVNNSSADGNTATGAFALLGNTVGLNNTAIGLEALRKNENGNYNTASGSEALYNNTSGYNNTASGVSALYSNTTGFTNTASGYRALYSNQTGSNNIGLGLRAGFNIIGSNNIAIGNEAAVNDSGTIRIGDGDQTRAFISGIRGVTTGVADGVAIYIDSAGQLGTSVSSRRYKEDIAAMDTASTRLLDLRPVTFRYKQPTTSGDHPMQYGLIAEEVAEHMPELVIYDKAGQPETVKYQLLSVLLLNELKKEHSLNEKQQTQLVELKGQVEELGELVRQMAMVDQSTKNLVALNAAD